MARSLWTVTGVPNRRIDRLPNVASTPSTLLFLWTGSIARNSSTMSAPVAVSFSHTTQHTLALTPLCLSSKCSGDCDPDHSRLPRSCRHHLLRCLLLLFLLCQETPTVCSIIHLNLTQQTHHFQLYQNLRDFETAYMSVCVCGNKSLYTEFAFRGV